MITKIYVVTCDNCGRQIDYYEHHKPNYARLRADMPLFAINNGKPIIFCCACAAQLN